MVLLAGDVVLGVRFVPADPWSRLVLELLPFFGPGILLLSSFPPPAFLASLAALAASSFSISRSSCNMQTLKDTASGWNNETEQFLAHLYESMHMSYGSHLGIGVGQNFW